MTTPTRLTLVAALLAAAPCLAQSTALTYQGRLASAGVSGPGTYDLRFRLYDSSSADTQVGATLCADNVVLANDGTFTVTLDFGAQFATAAARYLEIDTRPDTGLNCGVTTGFVTLTPRQLLTAAPSATYAAAAGNASTLGGFAGSFFQNAANLTTGTIADARLSTNVAQLANTQTITGAKTFSNASNSFAGSFSGSGAGLTALSATSVSAGTLADARLSTNVALLSGAQTFTGAKTFAATSVFNGNVGIGVASPATPLDVSGSVRFGFSPGGMLYADSNFVGIFTGNGGSSSLSINQTTGNVGLGTFTPGERFELFGPDVAMRVRNSNDTGGGFIGDTFSTLQLGLFNPSAAAWGVIPANTRRSLLGLDSSGKVGTLTNAFGSPVYRNYLDDGAGRMRSAGDFNIDFGDTNTGVASGPGVRFGLNSGEAISSARTSGSPNRFGISFFTNSTNRLVITQGGGVGIGTTAPSSTLTVAGTIESTSGGFKFPDGTIQTTMANGVPGPQGPQGIQGPQGPTGLTGPSGSGGGNWQTFGTAQFAPGMSVAGANPGSLSPDAAFTVYSQNGQFESAFEIRNTSGGRVFLGTGGSGDGVASFKTNNGSQGTFIYSDGGSTGALSTTNLFAVVKFFREPNPRRFGTDITYACVEGPEAAAYIRGTAHLELGEAVITFPDHFLDVATEAGMTVQVTPLSEDSQGLAVVEKKLSGVVVRELHHGVGTYDFDYIVTAVRKGHEQFPVIRPWSETRGEAAAAEMLRAGPAATTAH